MTPLKYTYFAEDRPAVLVASHARAGTHFLMNALASCYGYVSRPWVNFDPINIPANYYDPPSVRDFLLKLAKRPLANVVKSHYPVDCFAGELPHITRRYAVFYICRHPVPVLLSCWRFMHRWPWAGPVTPDPLAFARAEPCGALLRYQFRQYPDMLRLWAAHAEGWFKAAQEVPGITLVRYEDLDTRFEETVQGLSRALGRPPQAMIRPPRGYNVILGGPEDPTGRGTPPDIAGLERLCRETVGDTMARFGY